MEEAKEASWRRRSCGLDWMNLRNLRSFKMSRTGRWSHSGYLFLDWVIAHFATPGTTFFPSRLSDNADMNGEDTSSSSSEEEKEGQGAPAVTEPSLKPSWASGPQSKAPPSTDRQEEEEDNEEEEGSCLPTIFFSHTVEPKKVRTINTQEHYVDFSLKDSVVQFSTDSVFSSPRLCVVLQVRINTGKNTTLKFSERKEQKEHSKRKKKNSHSNGHSHHELHKITTPADIYRWKQCRKMEWSSDGLSLDILQFTKKYRLCQVVRGREKRGALPQEVHP